MIDWLSHAQWFDPKHASEWISGLTGAGGAILGSVVTITWTEWFNRRTRTRERRERYSAAAFSLFHKLDHIYASSLSVQDGLRVGLERHKEKPDQPLCTVVQPLVGMYGEVQFTADEIWAVTASGGSVMFNKIKMLDQAYNALRGLLEMYKSDREALWTQFSPINSSGIIGTIEITHEQKQALDPKFASLDSEIDHITETCQEILQRSFEAIKALAHAKGRPLGKRFKVTLKDPTGAPTMIRSADAPGRGTWLSKLWPPAAPPG